VAAHLEPEILLIDEVLAVGDVVFQKKCLGKMNDVAQQGRTVLFVSHNLGVVKELCQSSLVLNNGQVEFRGPVGDGLICYSRSTYDSEDSQSRGRSGWRGVCINGEAGGASATISSRNEFFVESWLDLTDEVTGGNLFLILNDSVGNTVLHHRVRSDELCSEELAAGRYKVRVDLPTLWLAPGIYTLHFKFIGHGSSLAEQRYFSERATLDVIGSASTLSKAYLAPVANWSLIRHTEPARQRA
jgi:lipopolysaccharide transport system ATP-binding protein